jgi:NAD(P)-dependent dehydrogenase (short-subunit alcohol dehydrogenase family)
MNKLRFDQRVAVVTGGGRGLGREYALLLAARGAKVVVNDNGSPITGEGGDVGPAQDVVDEITAAGGEAVASVESVATPEGGRSIVGAALDNWGRVDILIHSAGNVRRGTLDAISDEDFLAVVNVHLLGGYYTVRPAFEHMAKAGYGRIVLTGSIGGIYGNPAVANYGVSKAGLMALSNVAAIEGKDKNIKSNVILPAAVTRMSEGIDTTNFPPMGPEKVAPVVGWLAHESCSVSGEMLISAAGRVARAYVTETEGVFRDHWTIEDVAANIDEIRDPSRNWTFHPCEDAFMKHLGRSFAMTKQG